MKRIISILALFVALGVKSQVVGGYVTSASLSANYVPYSGATKSVNINTKSLVTTGATTLGNLTSAGTGSFGSTFTITGNARASSSLVVGNTTTAPTRDIDLHNTNKITTGQAVSDLTTGYGAWYAMGDAAQYYSGLISLGSAFTPTTHLRRLSGSILELSSPWSSIMNTAGNSTLSIGVGSTTAGFEAVRITTNSAMIQFSTSIGTTVAPTAVLDVTGDAKVSSTFSLGAANLTGGNTGTVAVLSDALFTTTHFHGLATIATTTFFYDKYPSSSGTGGTSGTIGRTHIPFNCTLVGFSHFIGVLGTLGTAGAGTVIVRINNTTDVTLTASAQYSAAVSSYSASNLSTSISAGDYIEIKVIPNTTPTSATNVTESTTLFFSRRP